MLYDLSPSRINGDNWAKWDHLILNGSNWFIIDPIMTHNDSKLPQGNNPKYV